MQSGEQPSQLCGVLYGGVAELRHHLTPLDPDLSSLEITRRSRHDLWMAGPDLSMSAPPSSPGPGGNASNPRANEIHHIQVPAGATEAVTSAQTPHVCSPLPWFL